MSVSTPVICSISSTVARSKIDLQSIDFFTSILLAQVLRTKIIDGLKCLMELRKTLVTVP